MKLLFLFFVPILSYEFKVNEIKCFGVIGDSISAGFSIDSGLYENRGKSFDIGGENDYITIPNIFHKFGADKKCAAYGNTFISYSLNRYELFSNLDEKQTSEPNCNVAISGAKSEMVLPEFNDLIVEWTKFDCYKEKKVLTVLMGANDICDFCLNGYNETISTYLNNMEQLFHKIQKNLINTFVNVISMFDVGLTAEFQTEHCKVIHYFINECPCILGRQYKKGNLDIVKNLYQDLNKGLYPLVKRYNNYKKENGNKIVIQPIMENFKIYNSSYLSDFDCFHPSEFGHKNLATILWNNMFLPPDKKIKSIPYILPIYKPKPDDYLM